jgi:formate dehydrogenase maturation protein FdhE
MKSLKKSELPTHLQEAYWAAKRHQQKYEMDAKQLWRTEQVYEALGEVFKKIKGAVSIWPDMIEDIRFLTEAERKMLTDACDGLLQGVKDSLTGMERKTPSSIGDVVSEVPEEEPEEDYLALVG